MKSTTLMSGALVAASNIYSTVAALHIGSHAASHVVRANKLQVPSAVPVPNQYKSQGCFGSKGNLTEPAKSVEHVSSGLCNNRCTEEKFWVSALQADKCYCGFAYPPSASLGSDDSCNYPCPGYGNEACGALGQPGFFSVWNTGINVNPPFYQVPTTSDSPTPTPTPTPSDHAPDTTQTVEPSITAEPPKANNPNVAGIAAGTVAGVVLVAGIIGVGFFFIRRKRNAEIEEEHRRNAAVNAFINGSKPPSTSGSISMTDSRLDPVLAHRRMSDGSIADNEDYSRRILRVTNA